MKRILVVAMLTAAIAGTASAQIPVTVTSQASDSPMTLAEFAENMTRWAQQYEQMTSQIDQMKQQYQSMTGSRNMGSILDNPALRDYLPQEWQQAYDAVKSGGYESLTGRSKSVYDSNKVFDSCAFITTLDAKRACQAMAVKPSQDKAVALDAYDAAKSRLQQIDGLMARINQTQDPKAIAELQGRIAIEQAKIQNEQTKLQLYAMVAQAEEKVQAQRQREIQARTWSARKGIEARAVTFDGQ